VADGGENSMLLEIRVDGQRCRGENEVERQRKLYAS
jgi:hypothetical protein